VKKDSERWKMGDGRSSIARTWRASKREAVAERKFGKRIIFRGGFGSDSMVATWAEREDGLT
jgi:hypothetical protein